MTALNTSVALLLLLPILLTGVCPQRPREVYVKAGEMASLFCPHTGHQQRLTWTSHILPERDLDLTEDMSSSERRRTGLLVHGRNLVVLEASVNHQGNYSCSLGNRSRRFWFRLTVLPAQSPELEPRTTYSETCFTPEACTLRCPTVNTPAQDIPNMTINEIMWHKEGESSTPYYISSVEEKDGGIYTCVRSYLYGGQMYNKTFAVALDVQPGRQSEQPRILSPHANDVFHVDLGSAVVIDCRAVMYSEFEEVFWLSGDSFVDTNESLPVYYNYTSDSTGTEIKMTASLVFREVSAEDLSKRYTCKLESESVPSTFVTVTLEQKASLNFLVEALWIGIGIVIVLTMMAAVLYIKLKKSIVFSLQDAQTCHGSTSGGKSYDALLVSYKNEEDTGMMELDRKWMKSILEERFGYAVYDCGIMRGKGDALSERIQQSRTVILVPTSSDGCLESGLLSHNHIALMKQSSRVVLIRSESSASPRSEELQHLAKDGHCVTWKGTSSRLSSSSFWKELQCYLPVPQQTKRRPLLSTFTKHDNCETMDTHYC
ncbi:interleukin-1 receptor accessory protein-like isoform X1 [Takifugu rubripes]|uniref:Interleukin-1 receptor accessory protein-like n=1 Tax=Takifugu rubripes TaxID=31033 RepID=A0A3B5KNW3_TAKRU|nr:interleukin-1 receptor accessory protein-like isoform X1 [Takifugu rubripes]XP_029702261.1 interleukin-1 receptor accessory protein-like isoform X1 [Takifugu rubripes]